MHWYDWHTVAERLQGRSYAITRGRPFRVVLDPGTPTGCCDFTSKRILINPDLFSDVFEKQGLSGPSLDKANFLVSRAVTGHEALHVLFSDPGTVTQAASESPVLKVVLNLLEDARIEKIGAETSHVHRVLFRFVNHIAAGQLGRFADTSLSDPRSCLSLLLRWRLGTSIPKLTGNADPWKNVLAIANKALATATCSEVLDRAREIVKLLGLDAHQDLPDDVRDVAQRMQSETTGTRNQAPMPNPLTGSQDGGEDEAQPAQTDQSEEPVDSDGSEPGREFPESGMPQSSRESGASGVDGQGQESAGADAPEEPSNPTTRVVGDKNGDPDDDVPDIEKLVEETATQACEDLRGLVPQDSEYTPHIAGAVPYRGRPYPDIVAAPYAQYLSESGPIAAELVRELKAEGPRAVSGPGESAGRFRARYYIRDSSRPFAVQRYRGMRVPEMALSLVIDRSGSMEDIVHELRVMAMAIAQACESLRLPLSVWALEGQVHIKRFDETGAQVLAKIAGTRAETLTRTAPTLQDASDELKIRHEEMKQTVLIHDGMPSDRTDFTEWRDSLRGIGLFCLFIMKPEDYEQYRQDPVPLRERMDQLVGPQNYAIAPVSHIARHWCSFIRNARSARTTLAG